MPGPDRAVAIPLRQVESAEEAGGKAWALAELCRAGIPVPEAFVIPTRASGIPGPEILRALGGRVAVRSSATVEDLAGASFAGQFDTVLDVGTPEALAAAVRRCRASQGSAAVRSYCERRGLDPATIRMAVIVQRMLAPEVAGVLFTVHPVRGREDEVLIEAGEGLADGLVAGRREGARIVAVDGQVAGSTGPLSTEQTRRLVEMGRRVQALRGAPQDIEWAIEDGRLWVLQARPITSLSFVGIEGQWTTADFRDGGVASDVVVPLVWSLYQVALQRALPGFLADLRLLDHEFEAARVFYGRPYWNLAAVKRCARRMPGFVEREFDRDLAVEPTYPGDGARTPVTPRTLLAAVPTLWVTGRVLRAQEARDRQLLAAGPGAPFEGDLRRLGDAELGRHWATLVEGTQRMIEESYFRTIFCASLAKQELKTLIGNRTVSYAALVGGLDQLSHFACVQALWALANRGAGSLESILARYGHHSRRELDLRVPRWREEPDFVAELAGRLIGTESPAALNDRQRQRFAAELARVRRQFGPWRRRRFEAALGRLRTWLWLREEMRDLSTRVYALVRRLALEIGRRAVAAERLARDTDVFYLTFEELAEALQVPMFDRVAQRRAYARRYRRFDAPNEVGRGFRLAPAAPAARRLVGIGCSVGVASGRVAVVTDLRDAAKLAPGDVLVCPFTDPGWTPLLGGAAAVVTETGGLLSHAAVICREYGIPAVLNVSGATRRLRDGQVVRVDGESGHVDLLD